MAVAVPLEAVGPPTVGRRPEPEAAVPVVAAPKTMAAPFTAKKGARAEPVARPKVDAPAPREVEAPRPGRARTAAGGTRVRNGGTRPSKPMVRGEAVIGVASIGRAAH